jgi:hypothetical protein
VSPKLTWDLSAISRTFVRVGRGWPAKRCTASAWQSITYSTNALHCRANICQNGSDCRLYAPSRKLPVDNRTLSLVVWRHPVANSTPPVIDSTPTVVDSRLHFLKLPNYMTLLETSYRRPEASGRRLEVLFRCLQAHGCQSGIVNSEICSLQSPSGDLQSSAETVQSITYLGHSRDRNARFARRTRHRTHRARDPPGATGTTVAASRGRRWRLGH